MPDMGLMDEPLLRSGKSGNQAGALAPVRSEPFSQRDASLELCESDVARVKLQKP